MRSKERQDTHGVYLILLVLVLVLGLAACDGEKKDAGGDAAKTTSKSQSSSSMPSSTPTTGILMDAAVSGVSYLASSGAAGNTDEKGFYKYNHGDTVEFKLGSLVIGKVKGAPIVTPMELAEDNTIRLQNLLILLQSLDSDNNPENGISIPANAASAVSAAINLDSDPATFSTSAELQKVREAGGIT
nr:adhesin [Nitrosomonadaceae bacterium]